MCFIYSGDMKIMFISFFFYFVNLNIIRVSNSLDPDQVQDFFEPDLGPNCLQRFCFVLDETAGPDLDDTVGTTEDPETKVAIDSMESIDGKFIRPHRQNF